MKTLALLIFFSLMLCVPVLAIEPLEAQTMEAHVLITNSITLEPTGTRYRVDEATGTLTWFPRENRLQEVLTIATTPKSTSSEDSISFHWEKPTQVEEFTVDATVLTRNAIIPVRERITFPLREIPDEAIPHLAAGEITDQNAEIQTLAQRLAEGKTDAYEVVFTLADWTTTNVNYSLASVGQPAVQKSSQVLRSRYGKCDELTSLFISMNRALGIPARFVAGYAYTNSDQFDSSWGGHGWAEVWLPGQGWVPFDVTYGQYGYLDAGHIALKIAPDAKETSIDYRAIGNDFTLHTKPLNITITPIKMTEQSDPAISIELDAPHRNVGFGSTVLIIATIENKRDYYVSTRIDMAKTTNTRSLLNSHANVLLKPGESRVIPFLISIEDTLERGYQYSFPIKVYSRLGAESTIVISSNQDAPVYDKSSYSQTIEKYTEAQPRPAALSVTCRQKQAAYVGKVVTHECTAWGATTASLMVCEAQSCKDIALNDGGFLLTTTDSKAGVYTRTFSAQGDGKIARFFITSRSISPPKIAASISAPASATPDDPVTATLILNHSGSIPYNLTATLLVHHSSTEQQIEMLDRPASLAFTFPGRILRPGENNLTGVIEYVDELGEKGTMTAYGTIILTEVSVLDRVVFALEDATQFLVRMFG